MTALMAAGISAQAAPLKIGLVETLSGPQASTGLIFKNATRYAIDQINAAGGWNGEPVQLVEYDNQGGPAGASDTLKAALADGVQLIVQGSSSAVSGQITEDVRKHNLRNPGKEVVFFNVGGEALADTSWNIVNTNGDIVYESVSAYASLVLAAGDYIAVAKNKDRLYQREFTVESGKNEDIDVFAKAENEVDSDQVD